MRTLLPSSGTRRHKSPLLSHTEEAMWPWVSIRFSGLSAPSNNMVSSWGACVEW